MAEETIVLPIRSNTVSGSVSTTGLTRKGFFTEVALNSVTWTALPLSPLLKRNAISIQNQSNTEIKVNYDAAIIGYIGTIIRSNGERHYNITDKIIIYAKSKNGTPTIGVEELS